MLSALLKYLLPLFFFFFFYFSPIWEVAQLVVLSNPLSSNRCRMHFVAFLLTLKIFDNDGIPDGERILLFWHEQWGNGTRFSGVAAVKRVKDSNITCRSSTRGIWLFMYLLCVLLHWVEGEWVKTAHRGYIKSHTPREMLLQRIYLADMLNHIAKQSK